MKKDKDLLAGAVAGLKQEGRSQELPKAVAEETIRRLADASSGIGGPEPAGGTGERRRIPVGKAAIRWVLAAAALIALGFAVGRFSQPRPMNMDELRETLAPALAASIEPAIRERLIEDMRQRYQVALAASYVRIKEELTEQYRDELTRFALQTLAASNAATNLLLQELVQNIDTAQTQDLRSITRALYQIELNRVQDKTQLAAGLQTLASRTQDEMSRFVHLLADVRPEDAGVQGGRTIQIPNERNEQ